MGICGLPVYRVGKANLKGLQCAESLGSCLSAFLKCIASVLVERIQQIDVGWPPAQWYEDACSCMTLGNRKSPVSARFSGGRTSQNLCR